MDLPTTESSVSFYLALLKSSSSTSPMPSNGWRRIGMQGSQRTIFHSVTQYFGPFYNITITHFSQYYGTAVFQVLATKNKSKRSHAQVTSICYAHSSYHFSGRETFLNIKPQLCYNGKSRKLQHHNTQVLSPCLFSIKKLISGCGHWKWVLAMRAVFLQYFVSSKVEGPAAQ